jgi:hypothetical protein
VTEPLAPVSEPTAPPPPRVRGAQRDAEIRGGLQPLAPGERPAPVTVAAFVVGALAVANLVALAAGVEVSGTKPGLVPTLVFCAIAAFLAAGLWQVRYWAVLGFEAVLGITVLFFALFLMLASNVLAAVICLAVVGLGGWLFWKLVRPMARVQMRGRAVE